MGAQNCFLLREFWVRTCLHISYTCLQKNVVGYLNGFITYSMVQFSHTNVATTICRQFCNLLIEDGSSVTISVVNDLNVVITKVYFFGLVTILSRSPEYHKLFLKKYYPIVVNVVTKL